MPEFPDTPNVGQVFNNGRNWYAWDGEEWQLWHYGVTGPTGPTGATGPLPSGILAPNAMPIGGIILLAARAPSATAYRATTPGNCPPGYLLCDGTLYQWSEHTALRDVIGTTYGGSVNTDWRVPDLRRRTPVGRSAMDTANNRIGNSRVTPQSGPAQGYFQPEVNHSLSNTLVQISNLYNTNHPINTNAHTGHNTNYTPFSVTQRTSNAGGDHTHAAGYNHNHNSGTNQASSAGTVRNGNTNTTNYAVATHSHNVGYGANPYIEINSSGGASHSHSSAVFINNASFGSDTGHEHAVELGILSVNFAIRAS